LTYKIEIKRAAQKQMLSFPRQTQVEIARVIDSLANIPGPPECKKLRGTNFWRLRVGRYRLVYFIDDEFRLVIIIKIAPRREDIYQGI
jgi:mRNA interferase RelE/StbE